MGLTLEAIQTANLSGRILVERCLRCNAEQTLPAPCCIACGNLELETFEHTGNGRIFSWVVAHVAFEPEFTRQTPYTIAMVTLEGGARVYGRLRPSPADENHLNGALVELDEVASRESGCLVFRPCGNI